jgi:hypothetical protein
MTQAMRKNNRSSRGSLPVLEVLEDPIIVAQITRKPNGRSPL